MEFKPAVKYNAKLRLALIGPAGSGKTYSALNIAGHLGQRVALIDTEHGSASKYADLFHFDVLELPSFSPQLYIEAITAACTAQYDVLIVDSLSHAWMGRDGALEMVDKAARRGGNSFAAWRDVTPLHNQLVDTMLASTLHLIVTMRAKMEYLVETDDKTKKTTVRKVGLQPVQGLEYEFDVVADMDLDNTLIVSKTRCPQLKGQVIPCPGHEVASVVAEWLRGLPAPTLRDKLVGRINDLMDEATDLGEPVKVDASLLTGGSEAELTAFGKQLRVQVDAIRGSNGR